MEQPQHEQIMNALLDIKGDVGEIKGEVKGIKDHMAVSNDRLNDHSKRISDLKTGQTVLKTKAGFFAGGASLLVIVAFEWIKSQFK